jgi:hypothetical protein
MSDDKDRKINHDAKNSIIIINSISQSTSRFINKYIDRNAVSEQKIELFIDALSSIQEETAKLENYLSQKLLTS